MKGCRVIEIIDQGVIPAGRRHRIFTSLEGENPGGSIKDHLVLGAIAEWSRLGELVPGRILAEASAGSTALSLAYYAREKGLRCTIFAPSSLPKSKLAEIEAGLLELGAELKIEPPETILESLRLYCVRNHALCPGQNSSHRCRAYYASLGAGIISAIGPLDAIIGAVGTGHSLLGIADAMSPRPRVVSAEPSGGSVPGVRNTELIRLGPDDPVAPGSFDERIVIEVSEAKPLEEVVFATSGGLVSGTASFRLVLAAASAYLRDRSSQRLFLIGSGNWRKP